MATSTARVATELSTRYLAQLCKHFSTKVDAEYDLTQGRVDFPMGSCELKAERDALILKVMGDETNIDRLEEVVTNHLARFSFRENPLIIWSRRQRG